MRFEAILAAACAASLLSACASAGERPFVRVRPGESLEGRAIDMRTQSLVVELQPGDVVPLDVAVEGDLVSSPPGASIPLTVKKRCFLRIDDRGLRISETGRDFDAKPRAPGEFQLGVGVTKDGTRATLRVKTPQR